MLATISYANYLDCQLFNIAPVPWKWCSSWVQSRMSNEANTIVKLKNTRSEITLEFYERIKQPHAEKSIVLGCYPMVYYVMVNRYNLSELKDLNDQVDLIISWDSSVIFIDNDKRRNLWSNLEQILSPKGRIIIACNHFLYVSEVAKKFMNSEEYVEYNHHYRSNLKSSDFIGGSRFNKALKEAPGFQDFIDFTENDFVNDPRIMKIPYLCLFPPESFSKPNLSKKSLKELKLSALGIDIEF